MRLLVSWMVRAHCHRIIKLSGTLEKAAPEKELVENVHGVRSVFLDIGRQGKRGEAAYFIGKLLWSKGFLQLIDLLSYSQDSAGFNMTLDVYGSGPDREAIQARAQEAGVKLVFYGAIDHAELRNSHKIFVNPSLSEVLCTTTIEALAMGKWVIIPDHPSNEFMKQFPNCLSYKSREDFVALLFYAQTHEPPVIPPELEYKLTWEGATQRFLAAACIPQQEAEALTNAGIEVCLAVTS